MVELIFSLCLLALYFKFGLSLSLLERFLFVAVLITLSYIDIDYFSLPYSLLSILFIIALSFTFIYLHKKLVEILGQQITFFCRQVQFVVFILFKMFLTGDIFRRRRKYAAHCPAPAPTWTTSWRGWQSGLFMATTRHTKPPINHLCSALLVSHPSVQHCFSPICSTVSHLSSALFLTHLQHYF